MNNQNKLITLVLALILCCALTVSGVAEATEATEAVEATEERTEGTMVYSTATFGQKFSPFFYTTVYDGEVVEQVVTTLLAKDRGGAILTNGIDGTEVDYNGNKYAYKGMGNVEIVQNDDGSVDYNLTMREGVTFTDGEPVTIDDVIFGIYVECDPTYDGQATLYALPIEGMQALSRRHGQPRQQDLR